MTIRFILLLATLPLGSLLAQPTNVRFLSWDEAVAARKLSVAATDIKGLHPFQRTPTYKVNAEDGIFQMLAIDKIDAEGKPAVCPVKIPSGMIRPLVIVLPKPDAPSGVGVLVIEDDESSLKWGSIRVFNSTSKDFGVAIGSSAKLAPAGWKPVDFDPKPDETVPLIIATPEELRKPKETRNALFTSIWAPEADIRAIAIIAPGVDSRLSSVSIKIIMEDRRALAAQKAASQRGQGGTSSPEPAPN